MKTLWCSVCAFHILCRRGLEIFAGRHLHSKTTSSNAQSLPVIVGRMPMDLHVKNRREEYLRRRKIWIVLPGNEAEKKQRSKGSGEKKHRKKAANEEYPTGSRIGYERRQWVYAFLCYRARIVRHKLLRVRPKWYGSMRVQKKSGNRP